MDCYLITRYERRKGRYFTDHDAGSLAKVLTEARRIVVACSDVDDVQVKIVGDGESGPRFVNVTKRDSTNDIVIAFSAHRSQKELHSDNVIRIAERGGDIEGIRNFILSK